MMTAGLVARSTCCLSCSSPDVRVMGVLASSLLLSGVFGDNVGQGSLL